MQGAGKMVRKDDVLEVLKYGPQYGAIKSHVKHYLEEKGEPNDDDAVVNLIADRCMSLYHTASPSQKEALKLEDPGKLVDMVARDGANTYFKLKSSTSSTSSGGCYVATAVYGSYDCPQVWTLRRFRDNDLARSWYGRAFIRTYYSISPTLVKWFGKTEWFKRMWRGRLDRMVAKLNANGTEDTPYDDKIW